MGRPRLLAGWVAAAASLVLVAAGAVAGRADDDPTEVNQPPAPVAERTCHASDDFTSIERRTVNGTVVDLWCGDRLLVFDGRCYVQRGLEITEVACTRVK